MKKVKVLNAVSTAYLVAGILFILMTDENMVYGLLAIICFIASWGYNHTSNVADAARKAEIMKLLDEDGCGND